MAKDNWEVYTINIGTPDGETPEQYAKNESDRADLTDQFETELYALVQKYNSYGNGAGKIGLTFTAVNSEGQPIGQY